MSDNATGVAQPGGVKWGRIISLAGALGLCVSFFLPQVPWIAFRDTDGTTWNIPGTPFMLIDWGALIFLAVGFPFFAAILMVPVLAFRAVPRVVDDKGIGRFLAWVQCTTCLAVLIISLLWSVYGILQGGLGSLFTNPPSPLLPVGVIWLGLAVIALLGRSLPHKAAVAQLALWAYWLICFVSFARGPESVLGGSWVTIAACGLLAIGSAIDWFQCRPAKEDAAITR